MFSTLQDYTIRPHTQKHTLTKDPSNKDAACLSSWSACPSVCTSLGALLHTFIRQPVRQSACDSKNILPVLQHCRCARFPQFNYSSQAAPPAPQKARRSGAPPPPHTAETSLGRIPPGQRPQRPKPSASPHLHSDRHIISGCAIRQLFQSAHDWARVRA